MFWNVNKTSFYRFHLTFHENTIDYNKSCEKYRIYIYIYSNTDWNLLLFSTIIIITTLN